MSHRSTISSRPAPWLRALVLLVMLVLTQANALAQVTVTFFHNDIAGTPLAATDSAGNLAWKETYRPYGERLTQSPASSGNEVWFHGKPQDERTGLVYMGARYYDPVIGRFMGVDPVGVREDNVHSLNRYTYANNNPYTFIDPDGRDPISSWKIAENVAADTLRKGGWLVEQGVEVVMKGHPGELDRRGIADFLATKNGELMIGEVKDGKGAKLGAFQKAMFGEAGALERLTIASAERAASLNMKSGVLLVNQLTTSAKVAYTLTGELGGRAAGEASRRLGGHLATRVAFGTLRVVGGVPFMLLTQPGN
jgi:RHS repeat-associated protein